MTNYLLLNTPPTGKIIKLHLLLTKPFFYVYWLNIDIKMFPILCKGLKTWILGKFQNLRAYSHSVVL